MRILLLLTALLSAFSVQAEIQSRIIEYREGDTILEGVLVLDAAVAGPRPAVLIAHQWKGLGDYERRRAEMLARLGYVAFAIDVYGKGVRVDNARDASALAGKYKSDRALLRARVRAGLEALKREAKVDPARIGAIGYCFGGTTVLELARSGAEVAGVVSFHGGLGTADSAAAGRIRARVLVLHGADDPFVPAAEVAAFQEEMRAGKADWQLVSYGGAVHSFTDWGAGSDHSRGAAYNEKADQRSWEAMRAFFSELFR